MDHMFIMRLAALLFGGGIASCLFPGKSRMSHVLFLLLVLAETAVAHGRCVKMHTFFSYLFYSTKFDSIFRYCSYSVIADDSA